jgi:hypothetical protein
VKRYGFRHGGCIRGNVLHDDEVVILEISIHPAGGKSS